MPTILYLYGYRFFFYTNENNEPMHIHVQKAEMECKYWLDSENFEIKEVFSYNMKVKDKRMVKKIIFEHFDYIAEQWQKIHKR